MKNSGILAFALASLAVAAPLNQKRSVVYNTVYTEVFETVYTTTTVWVDPAAAPSSAPPFVGGFFEQPSVSTSSSSSIEAAPAYTAPAAAAAPVESAPAAPVAPPPSSTPAPYVPPPVTSTYVAPAPVASSPTPVVPTTTPAAQAPAPVYSAAAAAPSASAAAAAPATGSVGTHTGDITYYDVSVGTGSCGTTASNSDNVVALSHFDMNNGPNPNANPLCGKTINIYYNGNTHQATIFDTCPTCAEGSLDLTQSLFNAVAPGGDGRVHGVSWSFA